MTNGNDLQEKNSNHTILVVDDDPLLRGVIIKDLTKQGFRVLSAESGNSAIKILRTSEHQVDVIISDFQMPDGNGLELLTHIRGQHSRLPILIFITGFSEISVETCLEMGAFEVLGKPFKRNQLHETLSKAFIELSSI